MSGPAERRRAVADALPDGVDALLVTDLTNVRYLTGFTGSSGALVVRRGGSAAFATDGRYLTQASAEVPDLPVIESRAAAPSLVEWAGQAGIDRLGVEAAHVSLRLRDALAAVADAPDLVATTSLVETLRMVKDDDELAALRRACAITDAAFAEILIALRPGVTERDIAWLLRAAMHGHGAEDVAFDSIVAFGPHSAIPHHQPTDRALERGDLVKLDFGARYAGYHADLTRTVAMAPAADWQRDVHALVAEVQTTCRDAAVIGAPAGGLDELARNRLEAAGQGVAHGLGHGVGLQIHERPFLTPSGSTDRLKDRVPVTIEPGVYLPGRGGVRIEDTVVVRPGGAESLTTSPRTLIEID